MSLVQPHKVLIVDDSKVVCAFLEKVLSQDPALTVIGHALDPFEARDIIKRTPPDVLTLDVEMPRMDGLTFLRNLMRLRPIPVVMVSSLTEAGAAVTLDALEAGAVDFMVKRDAANQEDLRLYTEEIIRRVKNAARVKVAPSSEPVNNTALPDLTKINRRVQLDRTPSGNLKRLVAIGASTGGPEALRQVLTDFYASDCAVVVTQHMPKRFMQPFAQRLDSASRFTIALAQDGEQIKPGAGYVAPGDKHLSIVKRNGNLFCQVTDTAPVSGHRPSVDVMFNSLADSVGRGVVGVLLTGMGEDGALGLTRLHKTGTPTIVQDQQSSAVWGMPGRAFQMGGADEALALSVVGPVLNTLLSRLA